MNRWTFAAPLLSTALLACGGDRVVPNGEDPPATTRFSLRAALPAGSAIEGVALDAAGQRLIFIVPGLGIVETDRSGEVLETLRFGENGLEDRGFTDIAKLASGEYVLTSFGDTMKYHRASATLSTYFCLEPTIEPIVTENYAVAVDPEKNRIFAAPAVFNLATGEREQVGNSHVKYAIDGSFIEAHDVMSTHVVAKALAFESNGSVLYAAEEDRLHVFDLGGHLLKSWTLPGIKDASGLAIDGERLIVSDRTELDVVSYDLAATFGE